MPVTGALTLQNGREPVRQVGVELSGRRPHLQMGPSALLSGQDAPAGAWPDRLAALAPLARISFLTRVPFPSLVTQLRGKGSVHVWRKDEWMSISSSCPKGFEGDRLKKSVGSASWECVFLLERPNQATSLSLYAIKNGIAWSRRCV